MNNNIIDDEWTAFIRSEGRSNTDLAVQPVAALNIVKLVEPNLDELPICQDLYISTKTKVLFLNQPIDIHTVFWGLPIIEYGMPKEGIIKKQMKIVSKTVEEFQEYRAKLTGVEYFTETIIKQIDNPSARRIKFKDERKITIGLSKKDIMNSRGKAKNAFYNCFALILRFMYRGLFHEIHVKVFNTGKLEIPGILNTELLDTVKRMILQFIQPCLTNSTCVASSKPLDYIETDTEENVLINSNFNCGFCINRERLHSILRGDKYRIESSFDPCSYPGVKCKYYFNNELGFDDRIQNGQIVEKDRDMKMSELGKNRKYTEVSFMIFRTGSCLIVGNCTETVLQFVFQFIKRVLSDEYQHISVAQEDSVIRVKKTKLRKKTVVHSQAYYEDTVKRDR
uniref:Uncharacterized protein n=1 Tax=viral metagenome TaxID=1070528 RepID=A0A6C0I4M6_9ZZZZ